MRVLTRAADAARLLGRLLGGLGCAATGLALLAWWGLPTLLPLAAMLVGLAGMAGATAMALARAWESGAPGRIARAGGRRQAALVALPGLAAALCAWLAWTAGPPPPPAPLGWWLAGSAAAAFALLVAERFVAVQPGLPEAAALARLLRLPLAVVALHVPLLAADAWPARLGEGVLALATGAVALELAARAAARAILPPPAPDVARAAVECWLLRAARRPSAALAAPLRDHFGLDFSRSWALATARAALLPLALVLLLGSWALSGVVLVPADRRAVAERFGAPVAVLPPGLHAVLPWPLGRAVPVEFGPVHEIALAGTPEAQRAEAAEAADAPAADRLWEAPHPAELSFLVASETAGRQGFQVVSADLRVLYRVGPDDADALRSVVAAADPAALVRAAAARAAAAALAGRTLAGVLAERDTLAAELRDATQAELDRLASGLRVAAVVVEAIHPPQGAAEAYHRVQAAEIDATTTISTERGRAQAALAMAAQQAATRIATARAEAAETRLAATTEAVRFAADRDAASVGGRAFVLERTQESLVAALSGTPKTILDRRLGGAEPTVLDLRPFLPAAPAARDD